MKIPLNETSVSVYTAPEAACSRSEGAGAARGVSMKFEWKTLHALVLGALLALLPSSAGAEGPKEIRVGYPGVGVGNRPAAGGNGVATMHLRGMLEDEFKKDGIT